MSQAYDSHIPAFQAKMREAGLSPATMHAFEVYYRQLCDGEMGMIFESEIEPLESLPEYGDLERYSSAGIHELRRTAVIKLNGGLGTSMGMDRAKSLLEVKNGLTFLDIIVHQILRIRSEFGSSVPLLLMNSDSTRDDTRRHLSRYPELAIDDIPLDFTQNRIPKIRQHDLAPAEYPEDRDLEWNPPGHGDIYSALQISGCLDILLKAGYRYAFISNSDNLGAELDPAILGYFVEHDLSFLMEVAERTSADRKGGHLARYRDGRLVLREIAQCTGEDREFFSNIEHHRYFNTNTIWIDLRKLKSVLNTTGGFLNLPLIRNRKTVNPCDPSSEPVYQLETAMGSAISSFENASAITVPRTRFFPVKTTDDLIGLWSDAYYLTNNFHLRLAPGKTKDVITKLDERYYRMITQLREHFPEGAPSLLHCDEWRIEGEVFFERDVAILGKTHLINPTDHPQTVTTGSELQGDIVLG